MIGNQAALAELTARARRLVAADAHGNCWHCDHDVDVCDCGLAGLRHAVLAWDESAPAAPMPSAAAPCASCVELRKCIENGRAAHNEERVARDFLAQEKFRVCDLLPPGPGLYEDRIRALVERAADSSCQTLPSYAQLRDWLREYATDAVTFNQYEAEALVGAAAVLDGAEPFTSQEKK